MHNERTERAQGTPSVQHAERTSSTQGAQGAERTQGAQAAGSTQTIIHDVFERTEKKYVLSPETYERFLARAGARLAPDQFADSRISSLYYDTPEDTLINRSIEKPLYKEKLRIRAYDSPGPRDVVYVELKKKFKGIVYKRRLGMSRQGAYAYMAGMPYEQAQAAYPPADAEQAAKATTPRALQIAREIDASLQRHPGLTPATMVVVHRLSMRTTDGSNIRITFDLDAAWRTTDLAFEAGFSATPLYRDGQVIMEIKCGSAYPLWLVRILSDLRIYPQPCSKVGMAYEAAHPAQLPAAARRALPDQSAARTAIQPATKRGIVQTLRTKFTHLRVPHATLQHTAAR